MITNAVVSYQIKPEVLDQHLQLIEAVFDQLRAEERNDVEYKVMRLDDGVSFVHIATADTPDGSNPIPQMAAFQEFSKDIGSRVVSPPSAGGGEVIGSYHRSSPLGVTT